MRVPYSDKYKFIAKRSAVKDNNEIEYAMDKEFELTEKLVQNMTLLMYRKVNSYYTHMDMMEQFKNELIDTDMTIVLNDPLDFVYLSKSISFRKRFMKIHKKRFLKTDKEVSALKTPVMAMQGSIMDEDPEGMFTGYFNTTDMSNVKMSGYGDVLFQKIDNGTDISCILVPKQANINIEVTIMEDSLLKLENIKEAWNKLRKNEAPDIMFGVIRSILPIELVIQLLVSYKEVSDDTLGLYTYHDLYLKLRKYTSPEFMLDYTTDTSTGKDEIIVVWNYEVVVVPTMMNLTEPQLSEWVTEGGLITRGFTLKYLMPSMFQLRNVVTNNLYNMDIRNIIGRNVKPKDNTTTTTVYTNTDMANSMGDIIQEEINNDAIKDSVVPVLNNSMCIFSDLYTGNKKPLHVFDISSIHVNVQDYITNLIMKGVDPSKYITVELKELNDESVIVGPDRLTVNWLDLRVILKAMQDTDYRLSIYINNEDLASYMSTGI